MLTCVRVACATCLALLASACGGDAPAVRAITSTRVLDAELAPRWDASPAERFGFGGATASAAARGAGAAPTSAESGRAPVSFTLPDGWRERPPSSMRALDFDVGDGAECYLTSLPGSAGGALANVNRWRAQMGHAPLTSAEVDALPRHPLLGLDARLVDLRGRFTGMDGRPVEGEQRLLGLLHVSPAGSLFLKAVGPAEVWEREADAFLALAASLQPRASATAHDHDHGAHADHAHADASAGAGPLRWTLPAAWVVAPASSMSLANFAARAAPDVRVSVSLLPGAAGGVHANLDRWAAQVGTPALSDADFAALPRVPLLGDSAPLLERAGSFAGMGADPLDDALLLGTAHPFGAGTLFVKLVGPRAAALAQRDAFLAFCASLRSADDV